MTTNQQKKAAKEFAVRWKIGNEKQVSQRFWIELLQNMHGVEDQVKIYFA